MQFVRPAVSTLCVGQAASMGSLLLAAGTRTCASRCQTPASCCISPRAASRARRPTSCCMPRKILNLKKRLKKIYVKHTGQPLKKIEDALERDYFLTGEMAVEWGWSTR